MTDYWLEDGTGSQFRMDFVDRDTVIQFAITSQQFRDPKDRVVTVRTVDNHLVWSRS